MKEMSIKLAKDNPLGPVQEEALDEMKEVEDSILCITYVICCIQFNISFVF